MAENKKTLTVTQQVKELVYDIQNKAYLTGPAREAAGKLSDTSFVGQCLFLFKKSAWRVSQ